MYWIDYLKAGSSGLNILEPKDFKNAQVIELKIGL